MNEKLIVFGIILLSLPITSAQVDLDPGITPDSPLYGLDRALENIQRVLTFNPQAKAELALNQARERIAEIQAIVERGRNEYVEDLTNDFNDRMDEVQVYGKRISDLAIQKQFEELVANATSIHIEVLEEVKERVPEQAKEAIQNAIDKGQKEIERAEEKVEELKDIVPEQPPVTDIEECKDKIHGMCVGHWEIENEDCEWICEEKPTIRYPIREVVEIE